MLPIMTSGMASVNWPSAARTVASPVHNQISLMLASPCFSEGVLKVKDQRIKDEKIARHTIM